MSIEKYKHIVVEGPIGVGKTTLAGKLAESLHAQTLLERPEENPFLEKFYRDAGRYALPTQIHFLFQRIRQLGDMTKLDLSASRMVSDFLLDKDLLFARLTLDGDELQLYQQLYDHLRPQAPVPDLVIYLQAEPQSLAGRIRKRGAQMEEGLSEVYLQRLCESYSRFFYHYDAAPLLTVNTEHLNPIDRAEDFDLLLTHVANMRGKREYFNRGE